METIELISAWTLGVFTVILTNDGTDIVTCRMDLLDLETELEHLRQTYPGHDDHQYTTIKKIKAVLRFFGIHHAGLFIKNCELEKLINKSLETIQRWEKQPTEPQNYTSNIAIELREIWGCLDSVDTSTILRSLQRFFHAGLIKRIQLRLVMLYHSIAAFLKAK